MIRYALRRRIITLITIDRSVHTGECRLKFQTNTELIHHGVMYGLSEYPSRPNDPRVPSNPDFGKVRVQPETTHKQPTTENQQTSSRRDTISKAMKSYLERAKKHDEFMKIQQEEYDSGRRHLANMMGMNESSMTPADIDTAIEYLMPSGLFDHRARPRMRPPIQIYPTIKEAQFRSNGRPFHSMFYTGKPNFYQACFDLQELIERIREHEKEQMIIGVSEPPEEARIDRTLSLTSTWLNHLEIRRLFLEKIDQKRYETFIGALERLCEHPYSKLSQDFIGKFRKQLATSAEMMQIEPLKYDADGRPYMDAKGKRKHCIAHVTVRGNGTGLVTINGQDSILYFKNIQDREQVMTPLTFTGLLGKVDIECRTMYEEHTREWSEDSPPFDGKEPRPLGITSQSGAIRLALSLALKSFVTRETVEKMRLVGLLSYDRRQRERKKWGQEGARRKYTWKKR